MAIEHDRRQQRVARLTSLTRGAAIALAVILPLLGAGWWGFATNAEIAAAAGLRGMPVEFDALRRVAAALLASLPVLALGWGLLRLAGALARFGAGQPFVPATAHGFTGFGTGIIACALLKPVAGAGLSVLLTAGGPGPMALALHVSSDTLLLLVVGAVMTLCGWAFGEAALLAEEHAQFV